MERWRPEEWRSPYHPTKRGFIAQRAAFEDGADAMLEVLKRRSPYGQLAELIHMDYAALHLTDELPQYALKEGWRIFIPEVTNVKAK